MKIIDNTKPEAIFGCTPMMISHRKWDQAMDFEIGISKQTYRYIFQVIFCTDTDNRTNTCLAV